MSHIDWVSNRLTSKIKLVNVNIVLNFMYILIVILIFILILIFIFILILIFVQAASRCISVCTLSNQYLLLTAMYRGGLKIDRCIPSRVLPDDWLWFPKQSHKVKDLNG